jgi:transcription elongation GreA/GreB family factor
LRRDRASRHVTLVGELSSRNRTIKVVGEDEAEPGRGLVSNVSLLPCDLMGKAVGDPASLAGRAGTVAKLAR